MKRNDLWKHAASAGERREVAEIEADVERLMVQVRALRKRRALIVDRARRRGWERRKA